MDTHIKSRNLTLKKKKKTSQILLHQLLLPHRPLPTPSTRPRRNRILRQPLGKSLNRAKKPRIQSQILPRFTFSRNNEVRQPRPPFPNPHFFLTPHMHSLTWLVSEPEIFTAPETCMLNGSAMICSRSGRQAYWHVRGVVRQGGNKEQAQLAQELALEIAGLYGVDVGGVVQWEDFEWEGREGHV